MAIAFPGSAGFPRLHGRFGFHLARWDRFFIIS
jgi:hypothetical protein